MKKATIIIDNFTLQDVGMTLASGLNADERSELRAADIAEGYKIATIPSVGVQIESLLQLLSTIILHDELIVDKDFIDSWEDEQPFLQAIANEHLLLTKPFQENRNEWLPIRKTTEELLCFTPQLLADFEAYKSQWKPGDNHPVFSSLIWGTAGMLARSNVYKSPYLGHPSRGRVIQESLLSGKQVKAHDVLNRFINTERVKFFERTTAGHDAQTAILNLPPLALEVIEESSDISQLIPTAIQLRGKYQGLREWISEYQHAVAHDTHQQAKSIAALEAAAADINSIFKVPFWERINLKMSFSLTSLISLKHAVDIPVGAELQRRKKGSVRSAVTNLIKQPWDNTSLEKLFKLFGANNTQLQIQAIRHLRN